MLGKDLRIVFMGTPDFAVESLKALVENHYNVIGVITAPDKPAGRGQKMHESAVKKYAVANDLKVLQPDKLKNEGFLAELKALKADLQIIVAFRMLPEIVWDMPPLGTFNLHASLLPQYRGAAPLNWAIINGETETGVTTFLLDHKIDTGRILLQERVSIADSDNVGDLHDMLMDIGSSLVLKTVDLLAKGDVEGVAQSELVENIGLKHAPKIFKEDCKIDWSQDATTVHNLIRGLSPYPAAWTEIQNIESGEIISLKVFASEKTTGERVNIGQISTDGKTELKVACKTGWIKVNELQLSGKRKLKIEDFLLGFQQVRSCRFI